MNTIDDFHFLKTISRGGYERVYLAIKKNDENKTKYAIKLINKRYIVLNECNALATMNSQFVVRFFYSLQSKENIYLIMEYMIDDDLISFLCIKHILEKHEVQFYVAEIALALDYLHQRDITYRDLKPDNVLISARGNIKLTDLGLFEIRNRRQVSVANVIGTSSVCKVRAFRIPHQIISLTSDLSFRKTLSECIPKNEPLSFGHDDFNDHEDANTNNAFDFLLSSPNRQSSTNISQTIKQRPHIYQKSMP
ncbi:unnamed protein product [Rotaria sordida]|uniref:Serine/threonine-protein kinase greatwall n=1 Tax=Rotaria sordida TaxID=392033 RepID=A0A815CEN3_9BILA|nr:unnamed protein product [Rotaria sordida]CAF3706404.1 unnamed protein product [Rotaria sordida]